MATENLHGADPENLQIQHVENHATVAGFAADEDSLPPGYFKSRFFLGSMTAIGLGLMAGVAGFAYAAPILGIINADIGPVCIFSHVTWVLGSRSRIQTSYGLHSHTLSLSP